MVTSALLSLLRAALRAALPFVQDERACLEEAIARGGVGVNVLVGERTRAATVERLIARALALAEPTASP